MRNNTILEDIHAEVVDLDDKTMKQLMIECVNNVYMFIVSLFYGEDYECSSDRQFSVDEFAQMLLSGQMESKRWNDAKIPDWVKRIIEQDLQLKEREK